MKNRDYWNTRFTAVESLTHKSAAEYASTLEREFKTASAEIEKQISTWYQRFADNNQISLADARKWLNANELKELKWSVEEYIKYGEENAITGSWMKELESASAKVHISRLESVKLQLQQQIEVLYGNQTDGIDDLLKRVYSDRYYHTAFEIQKGYNVGYDLMSINETQLKKALSTLWTTDNKTFSDRIWTQKTRLISSVQTQLTQAIMRGDSPDKAIKAISKEFDVSQNQATRLVMTESAYIASEAQEKCFKDLDVEKYHILATLDSRTSEICQSLDGQVFDMKDYRAGVTAPPFHPWCRSVTVPWFEDDFGIGERAARGEDGKTYYVPSDMKYSEWKEKYVDGKSLTNSDGSGIINSQNSSGAKKTEGWRDRHAELQYEAIRHRTTDVKKIADNTNFTEKAIDAIKHHMFLDEHNLGDGIVGRFASDYDQVQAWDRLTQGTHTELDIMLLKHEYVELTQMRLHGYDYPTAHNIANKYHNWAIEVDRG